MYNSKAFKNVPYIIRFAERVCFELGTEYRGHSNIYILVGFKVYSEKKEKSLNLDYLTKYSS